jgi:glycosyltransferase involved in cell wall biosynthesis
MVYNFSVEEAHVMAPNFYQRCAESVFPEFGVKTEFLPNFRSTVIYRFMTGCRIPVNHAMLFCLVVWLVFHGRRYDAIMGWVTNGLVAAMLKNLFRWRQTKVILILYRIPLLENTNSAQRLKKVLYRFASLGADELIALDSRQAMEFERFLNRSPGTTYALKYGVDVEWYERYFVKPIAKENPIPVVFSPGGAHRDDETLEIAISQMEVTLQRYRLDSSGVCLSSRERLGSAIIERKVNVDYFDFLQDCSCANLVVIAVENSDKPVGLTSLLESMALGKPIIIANGASSRDYIQDGIDGLMYEQGNYNQLKEKIELLLNEPKLAARLGFAAKQSAKIKFGLQESGISLYRHLKLNRNLY